MRSEATERGSDWGSWAAPVGPGGLEAQTWGRFQWCQAVRAPVKNPCYRTLKPPGEVDIGEDAVVQIGLADLYFVQGIQRTALGHFFRDKNHSVKARGVTGETLNPVINRAVTVHNKGPVTGL